MAFQDYHFNFWDQSTLLCPPWFLFSVIFNELLAAAAIGIFGSCNLQQDIFDYWSPVSYGSNTRILCPIQILLRLISVFMLNLWRKITAIVGEPRDCVVKHHKSVIYSIQCCCPFKVIFHSNLSSIKGSLSSKVVFPQRSSSIRDFSLSFIKGCLPQKVIFHQRSLSIKEVFHQMLS